MSKLEDKIFESIKNKKPVKKTGFRLYNIVSVSYMFMMPMVAMHLICKYFVKNQDIYLVLMSFSFFCGGYNVYRELYSIYTKSDETEEEKDREIL